MNNSVVYVILVNWNGLNDTLECLSSLLPVQKKHKNLHFVVVDNNSSDSSVSVIRKKFPMANVLPLEKNIGFSGANNVGISFALEHKAEFIWFLNNDTVVDKDALSFIESFKDDSVGAAGSKIYFYKGCEYHKDRYKKSELGKVIWYAGGIIDWDNMLGFHRGVDEVDQGQFEKMENTDFITGCSMIVRSSVLDEVRGFDDSYFMYMEDMDLCLRIQKKGYRTVYNPSSILWHKNASSSGGVGSMIHQYYQTRNRLKIGFLYAPMRTRFALMREAIRQMLWGSTIQKESVKDAFFGAYGKREHI